MGYGKFCISEVPWFDNIFIKSWMYIYSQNLKKKMP